MADEFDQYKIMGSDPFAQYKVQSNAPGTISGNVATMSVGQGTPIGKAPIAPDAPYQKFQGSFVDRAGEYLGENLRNMGQAAMHPLDTISSMLSSKTPPIDAAQQRYTTDPAALAGDVAIGALMSTVGGNPPGVNLAQAGRSDIVASGVAHPIEGLQRAASALEPNLPVLLKKPISSTVMAIPKAAKAFMGDDIRIQPAERPAPAWQTNPSAGTEISIRGSTPEEIKAHLQGMADRAATRRQVGQPVDAQSPYQVVQLSGPKTPAATGQNPYSGSRVPSAMEPAQSTTIGMHGYHPESQTMMVQFQNGKVYEYRGVPQKVFDDYRNAESQGSFFSQNIKGRYETNFKGNVKVTPGQQARQALMRQP